VFVEEQVIEETYFLLNKTTKCCSIFIDDYFCGEKYFLTLLSSVAAKSSCLSHFGG
jgi:hypothetical protein